MFSYRWRIVVCVHCPYCKVLNFIALSYLFLSSLVASSEEVCPLPQPFSGIWIVLEGRYSTYKFEVILGDWSFEIKVNRSY
jgi:hypothetical protein